MADDQNGREDFLNLFQASIGMNKEELYLRWLAAVAYSKSYIINLKIINNNKGRSFVYYYNIFNNINNLY